MKITPVEIQQKRFRMRFRGFDMVEVGNFLDGIANEFEELLGENKRMEEEQRQKTEKIQKMEGAERDLRNAFIAAQAHYEEMKKKAGKEGEMILEEARARARKILETVQAEAKQVEGEIGPLKRQREEAKAMLKGILEMHSKLVDTYPGDPIPSAPPQAE